MALQDTYTRGMAAGYPGMHANMEEWNGQTKIATAAIKFGAPVQRDGAGKGSKTLAAGGEFLGIAKAMHVVTGGVGDEYGVGDNVPVVDEGCWYVKAEGLAAADAGKAANFNTATGAFTVAAVAGGIVAVPNAEIDIVESATLAVLRLRRIPA